LEEAKLGCHVFQPPAKSSRFSSALYNPEFTRITGYSEDELIGTIPLNIVQEKYRSEVRENFIKMLKGDRSFPYEFCILDKNGNTKWILEKATPIRYKGKRAALSYFMDISKSKRAEEERLAKEKLLSVVELAGAVGHGLNNPLQVVLTCTEKLDPISGDSQHKSKLYKLLKKISIK
jgi:PAS domain S-box-containing protein